MSALLLLRQFWYVIPILLLTASTAYYRHDAHQEHAQRIQIQAEYDGFKSSVEALGNAQIQRNKEIAVLQEKTNRESAKSYEGRLNLINDEYRRLRDKKDGAGSRPAAPDSNAPKPVTDPARDDELLAVLRQAQEQTERLTGLQGWIKQQAAVK